MPSKRSSMGMILVMVMRSKAPSARSSAARRCASRPVFTKEALKWARRLPEVSTLRQLMHAGAVVCSLK